MQNDKQNDNIIKNLLAVAPKHCDNCGNRYNENNFRVVKSSRANTVFHLKCESCGNAYMLNIMSPVQGMIGAQRLPINIDLNQSDEIQKFAGQKSVSKNEAIDIYNELKDKSEKDDFSKLID